MNLKILSLLAAVLLVAACQQSQPATGGAAGAGAAGTATTSSQNAQQQMVSAGDRIYFAFDRSDITAESRQVLLRQAALLNQNPSWTVTIEGHCDERGTVEYNLGLGERRATATKQALVALGVAAGRLNVISYGKERPAVVGHNEQAWAQNRRAVTVVN
ncbi:MAG TPA: peptidoglycan-associated lipoprotein Pal [Stellaceae bacterium]|jgi:peptidoglycan-associated lipoprotein|nr:peptidoglycan-associated lipoprotein Pal [Stellaceae bacterium]